jgi:hypothetical protein
MRKANVSLGKAQMREMLECESYLAFVVQGHCIVGELFIMRYQC